MRPTSSGTCNDEPVEACPPSNTYRFRKFTRRNKAALATVAAILLCLVVGVATTSWQAIRATRERDRAALAEREANTEAEKARLAEQRVRISEQTANQERDRATGNLTLAVDALDEVYLTAIGEERLLSSDPQHLRESIALSSAEEQLLGIGLAFYSRLAEQNVTDRAIGFQIAKASVRAGTIQAALHGSGYHQKFDADSEQIELAKQYLTAPWSS